jgi:choloylglycine hydrolase
LRDNKNIFYQKEFFMKKFLYIFCITTLATPGLACTGITLHARDGATVSARTIDWAEGDTNNIYTIVPRGHVSRSLLPDGTQNGMEFTAKYGFVGLGPQRPEFVVDGTNEAGLNAGLFYFPDSGKYQKYDDAMHEISVADLQVVSWILSNFATINEVKENINSIRIINIYPNSSTAHWRITEPSGRTVVMEIIDGMPTFYNDEIGTIANSPKFDWHHTNLNNYVNLTNGTAGPTKLGPDTLKSISNGTGMLGLPGDFSSPSRFVRAAFLSNWTPQQQNAQSIIPIAFHILNNLDVPIFDTKTNMPSATQWTIATDLQNKVIYYHTMYNRTIRKIDFADINFETVPFQFSALDDVKRETMIPIQIKNTQE